MAGALRTPATAVWAALVAATCLSWWLGTDHGLDDQTAAALVLLVVAFAKVHLVGMHFMELRGSARGLRRAFDVYVASVLTILVALYVVL